MRLRGCRAIFNSWDVVRTSACFDTARKVRLHGGGESIVEGQAA